VQAFENGDLDAPMTRMSLDEACTLLGVKANASFDDVLSKKNQLLAAAGNDQDKVFKIETAYDMLFMQSMKKRMTGELEVSTSVRYADVPSTPKKATLQQRAAAAQKTISIPKLPGGGVAVQAPSNNQVVLTQVAVFSALGLWAIGQAVFESPEAQMSDTAGFQAALGLAYSIYTLKENKKMNIGKAAGLSFACLMAGAIIGSGVQGWLRVDIVPLGGFQSPGVFVTEFVMITLLLGTLFLV